MRTKSEQVQGRNACRVGACTGLVKAKGLCQTHYQREYRRNFAARLIPSYDGVHRHLVQKEGKASDFMCEECDDVPAVDWAYDHADPMEFAESEDGGLYSVYTKHYKALCRACHVTLDRNPKPSEERRLRAYIHRLEYLLALQETVPLSWLPEIPTIRAQEYKKVREDLVTL